MQAELPEDLLSLVYATATAPGAWQAFCDTLTLHTNTAVMMFGHNLGTDESLGIIAGGLDPFELERYHAHFASQNPWMHMNAVMPTGMVGTSDQALERDQLFRTEFYNDWLRQQEDVVAGPFMMCHRTSETFVGMAAACRARNVDYTLPAGQSLFEALAPHMRRAIGMAGTLRPNGDQFVHLDANPAAIFLLRRSGRLAYANAAAEEILAQGGLFRVAPDDILRGAENGVADFVVRAGDAIGDGDFASLPMPHPWALSETRRGVLHAHIFPEREGCDFPGAVWMDPIAGAIVVSGLFGGVSSQGWAMLAQALGATPAEAQLAEALMGGESLYDYADARALSRHTARNQIRALLHKTGARNQAELVRHISMLTSPFTRM